MVTDTPDDDDLLLGLLEDEGFGLADLSAAITNTLGPTARVDRAPAPAGAPQRRFWIQEQVEAESGLNTLSCLIPLPGGTTDQALTQAVETLITRHEVLRTHFVERDGTVMETVEPSIPTPSLPRISRDPTRPPEDDPALRRVVAPPFALDRTPLWRLALTTDGADGEALLLVCHHAIVDWVGATLLARDLLALLAGTPPPPPTLTQADVAHWARGPARAAQVARARTYWRDRLADLGPPLVLVAAKGQGEAGRTSPQPPDLHPITLDAERADALRAFAARQGTTLFAVVLAAQATVLARFTLAEEVAIGTAVANRSAPGTDCVVGCLTDLLPLRCDLSGRPSLPALVRRLHGHLAEDFAQDALGFADIASLAPPDRRATGAPLFESLFNLLGASGQDEGLVHPLPPTMARADLALELVDGGSGGRLAGRLEVRADLVAPEVGAALAAALSYLLTHLPHLADRPIDTLPLTGPAHPHGLLARLHPPMPPAPTASLVDRIERAARSRPDAQAVLDGDRTLIFGALLDHSGALARALVEAGVAPGAPVAIALDRSADMVVALVAVLRAGGLIQALDVTQPGERLADLVDETGAEIVIAPTPPPWLRDDGKQRSLLPSTVGSPDTPLPRTKPGDGAYIIHTSGSTGRPKGVLGTHGGMVNRIDWMARAFPFTTQDRSVLKTSPAFVDFIWEVLGPLCGGIPSVIADGATARDPTALTALMADRGVTRIVLVPSLLRALLDRPQWASERLSGLTLCVCSGEPLPMELARRFRALLPRCRLLNLYGSSEVSADALWHEVSDADPTSGRDGPLPIGRPIPGNRVFLSGAGEALPGLPGEILIGGHGLALGYRNDPDRTAERFREGPEGRQYHTGDLGVLDAGGVFRCLGRVDRQVKIQGVRVEPGEVEALLLAQSGVREAHVRAREGTVPGTKVLLAHVCLDKEAGGALPPSTEDLRAALARRLPPALVPRIVLLDRLPLTASGKVDARALPDPDASPPDSDGEVAPRVLSPLEALVAESWRSVLEGPLPPRDGHFFALGGSSLQAILAMGRLGEALDRALPVAMLFETPRLDDLAQRIAREDGAEASRPPPIPIPGEGPAPATPNQVWLWEGYKRDPRQAAYNLAIAYRLDGPLDSDALAAALGDLVQGHPALRTRLRAGPEGPEQVLLAPPPPPLRDDLSGRDDPEAALAALVTRETRRPFALDAEPLFRARLIRLGPARHALLLVTHHAVCDGWSGQILVNDLARLYTARTHAPDGAPPPPPEALSTLDLGHWQRRIRPLLTRDLDAYVQSLKGANAPRPAGIRVGVPPGGPVARVEVPLTGADLDRLQALFPPGRTTPFLLLLAAWAATLARFGDSDRPLLATPMAGRDHPALRDVVGFLANPVLMAVDLAAAPPFATVVEAARSSLMGALRHQDIPLAWIQASGQGWPGAEDGPTPRTMILVEETAPWTLSLPDVDSALLALPASPEARVDLALVATHADGDWRIHLEYGVNRVPETLARPLARGLAALVKGVIAQPETPLDRLPLVLTSEDSPTLGAARPAPAPKDTRLEAVLDRWRALDPTAPAATDGRETWSRATLDHGANVTAAQVSALGVRAGDRVGLVADHSPRRMAALLGIFRLGATAVPLDPRTPIPRIAHILADANAKAVITEALKGDPTGPYPTLSLDQIFAEPEHPSALPPLATPSPSPIAAIIHTSGTTGKSKGVPVRHDALCRLGAALVEAYALRPGDRILQVVSPSFDVALSDLSLALTGGAVLVQPPRDALTPGAALRTTMAEQAITLAQVPAAILAATDPPPGAGPRLVVVGGEACPPDTARLWSAGRRLVIAYGPTEATVTATLADYAPNAPATTIGRPIAGARLTVRDGSGAPLPPGVPGELWIGGPNVTGGYLNRPDLTARAFPPDPEGGPPDPEGRPRTRLYRTGDRVRLEADGSFTFLGRVDRQIKLRGLRIEPGEVESALESQPGIARALVAVRPDDTGADALVAWVVASPDTPSGAGSSPQDLRRALKGLLSDALIPAAIAVIPAVPLTTNGKVDWTVLETPRPPLRTAPGPPEDALRPGDSLGAVLTLWEELLGGRRVGPDDNFFDSGGHSLLVARLRDRLAADHGLDLPVGELFAMPTPRGIAARLDRVAAEANTARLNRAAAEANAARLNQAAAEAKAPTLPPKSSIPPDEEEFTL